MVVTGASSGIGAACAELLAATGWRVFGASRRLQSGRSWTGVQMDISRSDSIIRGMAEIREAAGRIDVLVNCAGYSVVGSLEHVSEQQLRDVLSTNLVGTVQLCRQVIDGMRSNGGGRIVTIGSIGGLIGVPFLGAYAASKFALEGVMEVLRAELRPFGIHVSLIDPGDVATPIVSNRVLVLPEAGGPYGEAPAAALRRLDRKVHSGIDPARVARLVRAVIAARRPRPRYLCGSGLEIAGVAARRLLPGRWFEALMRIFYR